MCQIDIVIGEKKEKIVVVVVADVVVVVDDVYVIIFIFILAAKLENIKINIETTTSKQTVAAQKKNRENTEIS